MKKFFLLILIFVTFSSCAFDDGGAIDIIAVDYPPYTIPSLTNNGIAFSLLNNYAKKYFKAPIEPLFLPPARARRLINDGDWCVSFYPPDKTNKLSRFIPLSENVVKIGFYRLNEHEAFYWDSLDELKGKTVALLRANKIGQMHQSFINAGLILVYVESIGQGLQMVLKGRVDYAFGDNLALSGNNLTASQRKQLQFSKTTVHQAQIGFFYNSQCEERLFLPKK